MEIIYIITTAIISVFINQIFIQSSQPSLYFLALFAIIGFILAKTKPKFIWGLIIIWVIFFSIYTLYHISNEQDATQSPISTVELYSDESNEEKTQIEKYKQELLTEASLLEENGKIIDAIEVLTNRDTTVLGDDIDINNKITELKNSFRNQKLTEAENNLNTEGYESAIESLQEGLSILPEDPTLTSKIDEYSQYKPVHLQDLDYFNASTESPFNYKQSFKINDGSEYLNGLGIIPSSSSGSTKWIIYKIDGKYSLLSGSLGLDYNCRTTKQKNIINIYGDDILIYTSPEFTNGVEPTSFYIDISGVTYLKIESIGTYAYGPNNAWVYFIDTYLSR